MSEVHRYKAVKMLSEAGNTISYTPHGPDVVLASEHDAQLAALREELAEANEELDTNIHNNIDLTLRLAAAEQRNTSLISQLKHFASCADVRQVGTLAMDAVAALTKPSESGASERSHEIPGTSGQRLNQLANEGE